MKKTITFLMLAFIGQAFAQDTTALRWVGVNMNSDLVYFKNDTTDLGSANTGTYSTAHGIFLNSKDSLLYAVLNDGSGDRELYKFNPFTGAITLVYNIGPTHAASADISADGNTVYIIEGQAGTLGQITAINLTTMTEAVLTTALGETSNTSYGMEFHPVDSSLYIYEGSYSGNARVQRINLATLVNTNEPMVGWNYQLHGAKWSGVDSVFIVTAGYGCDMLRTDATSNNLVSFYSTCPVYTTDVEEFPILRSATDSIEFCPNVADSLMISLIYDAPGFTWFRDGVALSETNDTIYVFDAGTYRALIHLDVTDAYMWSEPIVVSHATVPVVNITQTANDHVLCINETITLQGATGGALQWFLDGVAISGANAATYIASAPGSYNQSKTNTSGCVDTAAVAYVITADNGCQVSLEENEILVSVYPNPVDSKLTIESVEVMNVITIVDLSGKVVYQQNELAKTTALIDFSEFNSGIYFVKVVTDKGEITHKITK